MHAIAISWPRAAIAMSAIVMTAIAKTAIAKTAIAKKAIAITVELQMACGKREKTTHNLTMPLPQTGGDIANFQV